MTQPLDMRNDETIDLDLPHGLVKLHRGARSWLFRKQQEPDWWRRLAVATHTPEEEYPWQLKPVSPFFDDEGYDTWPEVLDAVDHLELPR
jgi:hypothetical protein